MWLCRSMYPAIRHQNSQALPCSSRSTCNCTWSSLNRSKRHVFNVARAAVRVSRNKNRGTESLTPFAGVAKLKPMFRGRSWIRRAGFAILLLGSLFAGMVALPHAEGLDDFACSPAVIDHDESAHYVG